jgi:predicted nucleic acid-binding protein
VFPCPAIYFIYLAWVGSLPETAGRFRLELWAGVGSDGDRTMLRAYQRRIPELTMTDEVWQKACAWADRCRRSGRTAHPHDLAIAACASHHGVEIEPDESHFDPLTKT